MQRKCFWPLLLGAAIFFLLVGPAQATHVPVALDTPALWTPLPGSGYLNFVEPGPAAGVPPSGTEEYTGWVDTQACPGCTGATPDLTLPGGPFVPGQTAFDNGITHGDHADHDFVVEHRPIEVGAVIPPVAPLHPLTGFLTWEISPPPTAPSAHIDPATGLPHAFHGATVLLPDYGGPFFTVVDVFSVIADPVDSFGLVTDPAGLVADFDPGGPRDKALDYMVDFCDGIGGCVPGTPVKVFVPGWDPVAVSDDYVTRWVAPGGFFATHIAIDPVGADAFHDEVVQIDAIVVAQQIPEPSSLLLAVLGVLGLGLCGWRRRRMLDA